MLRLLTTRFPQRTQFFTCLVARCSEVVSKTDIENFVAKKNGPYVLIDVRNNDEVALGKIPTANHIPCKVSLLLLLNIYI